MKIRTIHIILAAAAFAFSAPGCKQMKSFLDLTAALTVVSVTPADGATGVAVNTSVTAVFDAAVKGETTGAGLDLALAADIRIASTDAVFSFPEARLGLPPIFGSSQRLYKTVGVGRAKELLFTGRTVDAEEAQRIGLINIVAPADALDEEAERLAVRIGGNSLSSLRAIKQSPGALEGDDRVIECRLVLVIQRPSTEGAVEAPLVVAAVANGDGGATFHELLEFIGRNILIGTPVIIIAGRHELYKSDMIIRVESKTGELSYLIVVYSADWHYIDLDRF